MTPDCALVAPHTRSDAKPQSRLLDMVLDLDPDTLTLSSFCAAAAQEMPLRYTLRHATNEDITFATISFQIVDR